MTARARTAAKQRAKATDVRKAPVVTDDIRAAWAICSRVYAGNCRCQVGALEPCETMRSAAKAARRVYAPTK